MQSPVVYIENILQMYHNIQDIIRVFVKVGSLTKHTKVFIVNDDI